MTAQRPKQLEANEYDLSDLCVAAADVALDYFDRLDTCVPAAAVTRDVAGLYGHRARIARVKVTLLNLSPASRALPGCVLGCAPDGEGGIWCGHAVAVVQDRFLLDPALYAANEWMPYLNAGPATSEPPARFWKPWAEAWGTWKNGFVTGYQYLPDQTSWESAEAYQDYKLNHQGPLVERVVKRLQEMGYAEPPSTVTH